MTHSLTAAALANLAFAYPETRAEALPAVSALIGKVLSPEIRAFDAQRWQEDPLVGLGGPQGHIGYLGHLNLMLAAYHAVGGDSPTYGRLFRAISSHLRARQEASPFWNAESYPGEIYVADNAVVVASLAQFDRLFPEEATGTAGRWLDYMDRNLRDAETGLFPFALSARGEPLQGSRGSGSAWNTFFLFYADPAFARTQYARLQESHGRQFPGLAAICEWPDCREGWWDVDSGPLIAGLSPSGSGFALAGARFGEDAQLLGRLLLAAEVAGFSIQRQGQRHYLLAPLVGDAALLATTTATAWE